MTVNPRAEAARALVAVLQRGRTLNDALSSASSPLLKELVYGVVRWYWRLTEYAEKLLDSPLRKRDADIMALILIGLYQLSELRVPAHAAINETVAGCEQLRKGWAKGLVNGVLRSYLRQKDEIRRDLSEVAAYSHPGWMLCQVRRSWPTYWQRILDANNERPPMVLRVNSLRVGRSDYIAQLDRAGLRGRDHASAPQAIVLDKAVAVEELPGFFDGVVSVQDTAAQWAAPALPVSRGDRVLDACAAPGGKLTHILETHPGVAQVVAVEIDRERADLVSENLNRLQLTAHLITADAADLDSWWDGVPFNCVLLDAPCSGTGVIRRHPDIKHRRRSTDLAGLVDQQAVLLERLWQTLAPDGYLLYVTCSIFAEENELQIERFVGDGKGIKVCQPGMPTGLTTRYGVQTLPGVHEVDGFYYSLLQKDGP